MYSLWRERDVKEMCKKGAASRVWTDVIEFCEGKHCLSRSEARVRILNIFMEFVHGVRTEDSDTSTGGFRDYYKAFIVWHFYYNCCFMFGLLQVKKVEEYRQNLYHDNFINSLPIACSQIIEEVCEFVTVWTPNEPQRFTIAISKVDGGTHENIARKNTMESHIPSLNLTFIAVETRWSAKFITAELGDLYDCYMVK